VAHTALTHIRPTRAYKFSGKLVRYQENVTAPPRKTDNIKVSRELSKTSFAIIRRLFNTRTGATLPQKVVVTSGVARIWCHGGTTIEAPKARASRRQVGWGMGGGVRSPAD